jgi:hypothetical protein
MCSVRIYFSWNFISVLVNFKFIAWDNINNLLLYGKNSFPHWLVKSVMSADIRGTICQFWYTNFSIHIWVVNRHP